MNKSGLVGVSGELPEPLCNHYDLSGLSADLDPTNPDHVYQEADDWLKSDDELSYREFEQKYHFITGTATISVRCITQFQTAHRRA